MLIHQPQPADALAVGRAQLLHGVHLPGVMRGGGPSHGRRRSPPGRRGRMPLAAEPPLQGALAGHRRRAGLRGEADADVAGAPGRMLPPQRQGPGTERVVLGGAPRAGPVRGPQGTRRVASALEQVPDRAGAELQGAGDGRRGLAAAGSQQDEAPDRRG
jgi:hypothetical protein